LHHIYKGILGLGDENIIETLMGFHHMSVFGALECKLLINNSDDPEYIVKVGNSEADS
jgi:hypothetical protein